MSKDNRDDPLAYGDYNLNGQPNQSSGDRQGDGRGIIGDAFRMLRGRPQSQNTTQNNAPQGYSQSGPMLGATEASQPSSGFLGSSLFTKLHGAVHDLGSEVNERLTGRHSPIPPGGSVQSDTKHRYGSFALQRTGNDAKWYVDGCGYMWAVSRAIEEAKDTIWILDCKSCLVSKLACYLLLAEAFLDRNPEPMLIIRQGGFPPNCIYVDLLQNTSNIVLIACLKLPRNGASRSTSSSTKK